MQKLRRFLATALAVLALILGVGVGSANAWPWSSTVRVSGSLVHCSDSIQGARVYAALNGESHVYDALAGMPPHYSVTFGSVPAGGGWAWMVVDCAVSPSYGRWIRVTRPAVGIDIHADL